MTKAPSILDTITPNESAIVVGEHEPRLVGGAQQNLPPTKDTEAPVPLLKWVGGKRWLVPFLRPLWGRESERRLVEPFCGGLAVALGLRPTRALLNDINPHLINFYRWVKRGLVLNLAMKNSRVAYYASRDRFNELLASGRSETAEAASLFYYLNKTGYNGLCRFNQNGFFNVPFGTFRSINYRSDFLEYKTVFSNWDFSSVDFEKLVLDPKDFVYADPPYDVDFTRYAQQVFAWDDQVRLAHWLASHSGPVVLSNQATPRMLELYRGLGFHLKVISAPRSISCDGNRKPAEEVLAMRNMVL